MRAGAGVRLDTPSYRTENRFITKKLLLSLLPLLLLAPTAFAGGGYLYKRLYHIGNVFDYVLKTDTDNNGRLASESIAESRHVVVMHDGVPFEKVTFVGMKVSADPAKGDDKSLAPGGTLAIPKLTVPRMTGPITDLVTYWVALSSKAGIDRLHRAGESYTAPNNFEQVSAEGNGKYLAMWGKEDFTITTTVDRANGMLLHAAMIDRLRLKLRVQCNSGFTSCGPEFPYVITRREKRSLVGQD